MNVYSKKMTKTFGFDIIHFTIQDINYDGQNDLVLLLASGQLQIHYNKNTNYGGLCVGIEEPYDFMVSSS